MTMAPPKPHTTIWEPSRIRPFTSTTSMVVPNPSMTLTCNSAAITDDIRWTALNNDRRGTRPQHQFNAISGTKEVLLHTTVLQSRVWVGLAVGQPQTDLNRESGILRSTVASLCPPVGSPGVKGSMRAEYWLSAQEARDPRMAEEVVAHLQHCSLQLVHELETLDHHTLSELHQ